MLKHLHRGFDHEPAGRFFASFGLFFDAFPLPGREADALLCRLRHSFCSSYREDFQRFQSETIGKFPLAFTGHARLGDTAERAETCGSLENFKPMPAVLQRTRAYSPENRGRIMQAISTSWRWFPREYTRSNKKLASSGVVCARDCMPGARMACTRSPLRGVCNPKRRRAADSASLPPSDRATGGRLVSGGQPERRLSDSTRRALAGKRPEPPRGQWASL